MNQIKQALQRLLAVSETLGTVPVGTKRELSRQDILRLVATNKLTPAQAGAVLRKRFRTAQ
ncbi:MAG: hypothetical protein H6969_03015 [Gammaproteobacteria bacterium]|nr:hypothetical protein [Gammaproteobacteria bacterium]MCP5460068.1 hypothetical protein [Gammaproteobacteria bacterium]